MTAPSVFPYDVAFSFLSRDLEVAEDLASKLAPGLSSFVYSRKKEELLGGDGMDRFASVFGRDARLTAVLYRDGWGKTPWTAFEESQIKGRGLVSRMSSFLMVRLDASVPPLWVPTTHLWMSTATEALSEIALIIRHRAEQEGATIRRATVAEYVVSQKRRIEAEAGRRAKEASPQATAEIRIELGILFAEIERIVSEVKRADPSIVADFGANTTECGIGSPTFSTALHWVQPGSGSLSHARLRIHDFRGMIRVPRGSQGIAGPRWRGASHYVPRVSDADVWVWREAPEFDDVHDSGFVIFSPGAGQEYSTRDLADYLVRRHFRNAIGGGDE